MKMWLKCTLMTQTIEAEAFQQAYFKNSIMFKFTCNFQVLAICEFWTLIIIVEIATPHIPLLLAKSSALCSFVNNVLMSMSGLAGCHTGQLTQRHNTEMGRTCYDLVLQKIGRKHLKGKVGYLFGKWEKAGCSAYSRACWGELCPGMEVREALATGFSLQKVLWKKRSKPDCSSQVASVGRFDTGWHDLQVNIK